LKKKFEKIEISRKFQRKFPKIRKKPWKHKHAILNEKTKRENALKRGDRALNTKKIPKNFSKNFKNKPDQKAKEEKIWTLKLRVFELLTS